MPAEKQPDLGHVLVVGGCGFLGHHIVRLLHRDYSCTVSVIDLGCSTNRHPNTEYHDADITSHERLREVFSKAKPDVVIHTASPAAQGADRTAHDLFRRVNVDGTQTVVDASREMGVKALVYTSSASVISDNHNDLINADESWPMVRGKDQSEYYSETKAAAEVLVLAANATSGPKSLLTCAIRPSGIMGEGDMMVTRHMLDIWRQGRTHWQVGDNNNLFDFTHVENVAYAHLLAARALLATRNAATQPLDHERVDGEAFIITNDTPVYFWDFTRALWAAAGHDKGTDHVWVLGKAVGLGLGLLSEGICWALGRKPTFTRQRIIFSCMSRYYNIDKAKRRLDYRPLVSLPDGVKRAVGWYLENQMPQCQK